MWWVDIEVPNDSIDRGSKESLACYPRRTFYPLSDGHSIMDHRITITHEHKVRACSACLPYSQASIYYCALQLIFIQFELTFARLRYSLGGDRPSQTTNHSRSLLFISIITMRWVIKSRKSGISRLPQNWLASKRQRLPLILHILVWYTIKRCSKGARGLSV